MAFVFSDSSGIAPKFSRYGGWPAPYTTVTTGCCYCSHKERTEDLTYPLALKRSTSATNAANFAFLASRPPAQTPQAASARTITETIPEKSTSHHHFSTSSQSLSPRSRCGPLSSPSSRHYHPTQPRSFHNMACTLDPAVGLSATPLFDPTLLPASPPRDLLAPPPIDSLPPELLDAVLERFPTPALLPLAGVSRRFHFLVSRLLYRRLRRAVALANHQIVLACYHPSAKISTPYLNCAYLGTDGLDDPDEALNRLPSMYSRFRPLPPDETDVHVRNYRAIRRTMNFFMLSDTASGETAATALQTVAGSQVAAPLVSYDVHLDEGELFSQLCTVTNLVRTSPRQGLFLNCVNINDGVIRVWRDWLGKRVEGQAEERAAAGGASPTPGSIPSIADDANQHVLWAYTGKHVGMRFRVTERASPLVQANPHQRATHTVEEPPVSFQLEYEELLVRSYELLLALEDAEVQEASSARGVVVSSL